MSDMITAEKVRDLFHYDPSTGIFTRKTDSWWGEKKVGCLSHGYLVIRVNNGKKYAAHRLAWLYVYGSFPEKDLDHINGDRSDNRIENLREASGSENSMNRRNRSDNTSGKKGVVWHGIQNKWQAQICSDGKNRCLGYFHDIEEAAHAYNKAAIKLHGEFAVLNPVGYKRGEA